MNSMMQFEGVAVAFALLALLILFMGFKLLASSSWVMGWLRGNLGIALVLLTGAMVLFLLDVRTYRPMFDDQAIATINFDQLSANNYQMRLVDVTGVESRYTLSGNQWYILINQYRWSTRFSGMGFGHGYRFSSAVGVTSSDDKARPVEKTVGITKSEHIDSWRWVREHVSANFLVAAIPIKSHPQPMVAGAIYEIIPSGDTINVKPMNEIAIKAAQTTMTPVVTPENIIPVHDLPSSPAEQIPVEVLTVQPIQ